MMEDDVTSRIFTSVCKDRGHERPHNNTKPHNNQSGCELRYVEKKLYNYSEPLWLLGMEEGHNSQPDTRRYAEWRWLEITQQPTKNKGGNSAKNNTIIVIVAASNC
eukprot:scaffold200_cov50-Cyclotella_meneghiniana.AAC.5